MPTLQMLYDIIARDSASPTFARVGTEAEAAGKKVNGVIKAIAGFAAVDLGYHIVKIAADFQQLTNVLVTAAGESQKNLGTVQKGIEDVAVSTGTAWQKVADATYTAEKAGYRGAAAIQVVKAAAQGAREENANLATVTNAVTSVLASYHLKASDAVKVTDELKTAAGESKTTMERYAGSLSTILPLASAVGISFADVAGVLATLTQHGTSADEGTQEIANTIRNLTALNGVAQKTLGQLGITANDVTTKLGDGPGGRGLAGTLDYIAQVVLEKAGPAGTVLLNTFNQQRTAAADAQVQFNALSAPVQKLAKQFEDGSISAYQYRKDLRSIGGEQSVLGQQFFTTYTNAQGFNNALKSGITNNPTIYAELKNALGGANGLNVLLQTTGANAAGTNDRIKAISDSAKNAGKDVSGWAITQKNFNVQLASFQQSLDVLAIKIGTAVLPALSSMFKILVQHPAILEAAAVAVGLLVAAWAALKIASLVTSIAAFTGRLLGLSIAFKTVAAESIAVPEGMSLVGTSLEGVAGSATRTGIAVTGIGTAVSRLATVGGLVAVASVIERWVTAASDARRQIDAIKTSTITDSFSPSQLLSASGKIQAQVDSASKANRGISGLLTGALGDVTFGLAGHNGLEDSQIVKQGQQQVAQLQSQADNLKLAYDQIGQKYQLTNAQIEQLAKAANISFGNGTGNTWKALNDGVASFNKLYGAQLKDLPVNQSLTSNFAAQSKTAQQAADKIDALANIVSALTNKQASALQASDNFQKGLNDLSQVVDENNKTLVGNSDAAINNRQSLIQLIQQAESSASAYAKSTGKTADYSKALNYAIPLIEAAASAAGLNSQQVAGLIKQLGLVPPETGAHVGVTGVPEAQSALATLMQNLRNLAQPIIIPIETQNSLLGVASPNFVPTFPQIVAAQQHRNADGAIYRSTVPGGIMQWAEDGGESFIPHDPAKRPRALRILHETAKILGVTSMADGGIVGTPGTNPTAQYLASLAQVANFLKALANQQATLVTKFTSYTTQQQQYASSLTTQIQQGNGVADILAASGTPGDIKSLLSEKIAAVKGFVAKMAALKKQGWADSIIRDVANQGVNVGSQYADVLLSASASLRGQIGLETHELGVLQQGAANYTTAITGNPGVTSAKALGLLNQAAFTTGGNTKALIAQAAAAQAQSTRTVIVQNVEHQTNASQVDLQQTLNQAAFIQRAGGF